MKMRRLHEEEARGALAEAIRHHQQELAALHKLENELDYYLVGFRDNQTKITSIEVLKNYHYYLDKLNGSILFQQQQVQSAEEKRVHCLQLLEEAAKNRKLVEKLREQRRAEYDAEFLRQEQILLDEQGMQGFMKANR